MKISNLKKTNPIFAEQGQFESTAEYTKRLLTGQPIINNIRKQNFYDIWQELNILRDRLFETQDIEISLGVYDPDKQVYPMTIRHSDYQDEVFKVDVNIIREKAKLLFNNWNNVKKKGILSIVFGDKIGLIQINFFEPISEFNFTHTFQPMFSIINTERCMGNIDSASFSPDGTMIAYYATSLYKCNNVFVYDLYKEKITCSIEDSDYNSIEVTFSNNSQYVVSIDEFISMDCSVFDLNSNSIIENCYRKENDIFTSFGEYLCTINKPLEVSPNGRYKLVLNSKNIDIYRMSFPTDSKNLQIVEELNKIDFIETRSNVESNIKSISSDSDDTELNAYRKKKFLNSSVDDIDSRDTGLSMEELEWLYQEAKKQGYCD